MKDVRGVKEGQYTAGADDTELHQGDSFLLREVRRESQEPVGHEARGGAANGGGEEVGHGFLEEGDHGVLHGGD